MDAQIPDLTRAIPGLMLGSNHAGITSPYFPQSLLDQQQYFHQPLIQGIREFWCDRRGTLSKTGLAEDSEYLGVAVMSGV